MSLIRSLLALAALLAIVTADYACTTKTFGQRTGNTVPLQQVTVPPPGGEIDVPITECAKYGYGSPAVGELVTVCNLSGSTTPDVFEKDQGVLTPLEVVCTDCTPGGVSVDVTLYCPDR